MEEDFELRLDDPYEEVDQPDPDDKSKTVKVKVRVGEGGQIRVKRGSYLCRTSKGEYYTLDEPTFAKTHQLFVAPVGG